MATIQAINWPQNLIMLIADTHQETFPRRITITYVQVNDQGERVVGGVVRTQTITGANYDTMLGLNGGFVGQAVAFAAVDGTFDQGVTVITIGPSSSVSPSTSPSASASPSSSASSSPSASPSRSASASQSPSASISPSHSQSPSSSASPSA